MYLLVVAALFNLFVINSALTDRGEFDWKKLGTTVKGRIAGGNGGVTVASGGSFSLNQQYQPRVTLMSSTTAYQRLPNLLGSTIQFIVDLSQSTCNCNAALYLVDFPSSATPDYYSDAQQAAGTACVEIDMIEANTHAFQATAHSADAQNDGKWGCAWNVKSAQGYGPGGSAIDTGKPFTVDFAFTTSSSGKLSTIKIKLSQSGKSGLSTTLSDSGCTWLGPSNYISALSPSISSGRMVLIGSYWSGGMDWLDSCSSGVTCPSASTITFSSLQLISGISAITTDETSNNNAPFVQSPVFIGIMCAVGLLLLIGVIAFIIISRKNALNQEIV